MAIDAKNPINESQFIANQQAKFVLIDEAAQNSLKNSIKASTLQNYDEFGALVNWFCKCLEQLMGPFAEWRRPIAYSNKIEYGNESDVYFRFDIFFGGYWKSNLQITGNPASTRNSLPPFDLDSNNRLHIEDSVTREVLDCLISEFLLPSRVRASVNKFGEFAEGHPCCTYKPTGDMMVGFSVCYEVSEFGYVNTGIRKMQGKSPTPLYVLSRISNKLSTGTRNIAMDRVMSTDGSMI